MPTFKLLMEFDESGALKAVHRMDEVAAAAKKAEDSLNKAGDAAKELDKISDKAELARKAMDLLRKGLKLLSGIGIPLGFAAGMEELISSSKKLKSELDALEKQYEALGARAGWTKEEMAGLEKLMVQNGIGAVEARKNVMTLTEAWIDASKGAPLLAAALDSTVISGRTVEETFKSMTQAIENGNAKSLEALGIYANFDDAYESMANRLGTTVNALTEQEKAQARVDATLEAAAANAGLYEASLEDSERAQNDLQASLTELQLEIADAFGAETVGLINAVADAVRMLGDVVQWTKGVFGGLGAVIRGELSLGELKGMSTEQRQAHLANYNNEDWLKKQQAAAKARMDEAQSNLRFALTDGDTAAVQKVEQEYKFYTGKLSQLEQQRQREQAKAQIGERQQEARRNQEKLEIVRNAEKAYTAMLANSVQGRRELIEKNHKDYLAIQESALKKGDISQETYNERILKGEEAKKGRLAALERSAAGPKKAGAGAAGSRVAGSADAATRQLENYTRKIELMTGASSKASQELEKALEGIARTGQAAGLAAGEIEALQNQYVEAFKTDSLAKFDKEVLRIEGNVSALRELEIAEKLKEWSDRFLALGMSAEEATPAIERMKNALEREKNIQDLQTGVQFLKDLESLGGAYGLTVQKQNELLEYQAALYREKLPADMLPYVDQWERLKKLENDDTFMGGLQRGIRKFGADYGDLASTVEGFTTQMGSSISSTLSNAFTQGKFSAQDFFSSLVNMAAQAASNYFIGLILKGIGNSFGSGSSGGGPSLYDWTPDWLASARGNVFSGGNLASYSNRIVKGPTLFDYGSHYTAFAKGAGLMGEAGPEAVMPLDRTRSGDLGVRVMYDRPFEEPSAVYGRMIAEMNAVLRDERQSSGNMPTVNVNIQNNAQNAEVQAGQMRPDGNGGFTMDIIVSQIEQAMVGNAKRGKSPLQQYQQQAYGMNRAGVIARGKGRN